MPRRKLKETPEQIILKAIKAGASWSELLQRTGLSRACLSKHLRKLEEMGLVEREVDKDKKPPKVYYKKAQTMEVKELESFPRLHLKTPWTMTVPVYKGKFKTLYEVSPKGKAFCDVVIYLDEEKRDVLEAIASFFNQANVRPYPQVSLHQIASMFIDILKEAMYKAYEFREWRDWDKGPLSVLEIIEQEKKALDFEATLLLHFNGKEIIKQIDWEREIESFRKLDERAKQCWRFFVETVTKDPSAQLYWLIDETIEKARKIEWPGFQKFLAAAFHTNRTEIVGDMWAMFSTPEKAKQVLLNEVFASILSIELTERQKQKLEALRARAEEALDILVRDGVIEFVPIYLPRLNKEKATKIQLKAKSGYPSPTAYLTEHAEGQMEDSEAVLQP